MAQHTILLVDDEPDILDILSYNLEKEGFIVHAASNGREGVELARKMLPDLILLDVMMPELDGFAVTERIRAQKKFRRLPLGEERGEVRGVGVGDALVEQVHLPAHDDEIDEGS